MCKIYFIESMMWNMKEMKGLESLTSRENKKSLDYFLS